MIDGRNVIAVVPARAGSKAIADKNLQPLGGQPLITWPILVAQQTPAIDRVIVSTDGESIASTAARLGAEVYDRPEPLASDSAPVIDTIRDLTSQLESEDSCPDIMVLLESTSPFRSSADISICLERLVQEDLDSIATFATASLNPHRAWRIEGGLPTSFIPGSVPWLPRQQLPAAWQLTGTVYAFNPINLPKDQLSILYGRVGAHIVDELSTIDIDTDIDLKVANALFESSHLASLI